MKYLEQIPSDEWVQERRQSLGGSEVAAALGQSSFMTPLKLWMIKQGQIPSQPSTPVTEFGHVFEPVMAEKFQQLTGLKTRNIQRHYEHPEYPFLRGNIDRQIVAGQDNQGTGLLELKTTTSYRLKHLDGYPVEWTYQIQFYLGLTGYQYAYLLVYERDTAEFHTPVKIERNEAFIQSLISECADWWHVHMVHGLMPEPINGEDRLILFPHSVSHVIEASAKTLTFYHEVLDIRKRIKRLQDLEEQYSNLIKDQLGTADRLVHSGQTLVSWKTSTSQRLDTTKFKEDHAELYKQYLKTSETRRFNIHTPKEEVCL